MDNNSVCNISCDDLKYANIMEQNSIVFSYPRLDTTNYDLTLTYNDLCYYFHCKQHCVYYNKFNKVKLLYKWKNKYYTSTIKYSSKNINSFGIHRIIRDLEYLEDTIECQYYIFKSGNRKVSLLTTFNSDTLYSICDSNINPFIPISYNDYFTMINFSDAIKLNKYSSISNGNGNLYNLHSKRKEIVRFINIIVIP